MRFLVITTVGLLSIVAGAEIRVWEGSLLVPRRLTALPDVWGGFNQPGECTNPVKCTRYKFESSPTCHYCQNGPSNPYRCNTSTLVACPDYSTGGTICGDQMVCDWDPELGCDWASCTSNGYCTEVDCH